MTRRIAWTFFVLLGGRLVWNIMHVLQRAPRPLCLFVSTIVAFGIYVHTWRRVPPRARGNSKVAPVVAQSPSTALCLRGFTYGLSPETLDRLYGELVAYLDTHPEIRLLAWDGDLNQEGSYATTIQRLLRDRPTLPCVAFKKDTSMHKLETSYSDTNAYGVTMHGFDTVGDVVRVSHDAVSHPWAPSAQLTVIGFPEERLMAKGRKDYVELSYAGLAWLRRMGHMHVTILTMGEGEIVKDEYDRLHDGVSELDESGVPLFPDTTWTRLMVSRAALFPVYANAAHT